ncbi:unnamed protein product [Parnassius apollo]|uniref:(apollo) hypothetical protein n=1 Tax=Parnassius apollo TaxID=110799 RepID=A0A8S3XZH5_PARAO|nr:unnamed protein product [Parnassius apollo]
MTYCLDVEMFISEVEKYPEIWDLNSEDNRHRNRKQRAWGQVAQVFIADFDEMTENEKLEVYRKLHSKWRNIRDSYVRDLKRKDSKKAYMYAKHLTFLDNLYKTNNHSGSEDSREWNDEDTTKLKKLAGKRRRFDILNESNVWTSDGEEEVPSTIDNLKRRRVKESKAEKIEFVDAPYTDTSCSYTVEDEDRSFFESLLPAVREFNVDQKLEFRSEVINLIKDFRKNGSKFKIDLS